MRHNDKKTTCRSYHRHAIVAYQRHNFVVFSKITVVDYAAQALPTVGVLRSVSPDMHGRCTHQHCTCRSRTTLAAWPVIATVVENTHLSVYTLLLTHCGAAAHQMLHTPDTFTHVVGTV
jgi:hypothetical protein